MARRNSPSVNAVRYLLFLVGVLFLSSKSSGSFDSIDAVAVAFVIVGFPYFLFGLLFRFVGLLFRLFFFPFRFIGWLLGLCSIVKRKPAPLPQKPQSPQRQKRLKRLAPLPRTVDMRYVPDEFDLDEDDIDEFDTEDDEDDAEWGSEPATYRQLGFIRHLGGNPPEGLTKGDASEMIDALLAKKRAET